MFFFLSLPATESRRSPIPETLVQDWKNGKYSIFFQHRFRSTIFVYTRLRTGGGGDGHRFGVSPLIGVYHGVFRCLAVFTFENRIKRSCRRRRRPTENGRRQTALAVVRVRRTRAPGVLQRGAVHQTVGHRLRVFVLPVHRGPRRRLVPALQSVPAFVGRRNQQVPRYRTQHRPHVRPLEAQGLGLSGGRRPVRRRDIGSFPQRHRRRGQTLVRSDQRAVRSAVHVVELHQQRQQLRVVRRQGVPVCQFAARKRLYGKLNAVEKTLALRFDPRLV